MTIETDTRVSKDFASVVAGDAGYQELDPDRFVPAPETVLVRKHPKITKRGSIDLPEIAQRESITGDVVAVSDNETFLAVGDMVLIDPTAAQNPAAMPFIDDENLIVLHCYSGRESDILGKFKPK
jgi:co-chaperonin GroES (HSP10)